MAHRNDSTIWQWLQTALSVKYTTFVVILFTAMIALSSVAEADVLWQTKLGEGILDGGGIVASDTFSWTSQGSEYLSNSWLWNVLLALSYRAFGDIGITLVAFIGVLLINVLFLLTLRKQSYSWRTITIIVLANSVLIYPWLTQRPQLFDYVAVMVFVMMLSYVRNTWILILLTMPLLIAWNNMHLTGLVGVALFAGLLFVKTRHWIYSLVLIIGGILACSVTPYGLEGLLKPLTTSKTSMGIISEWQSPWLLDSGYVSYFNVVAILFLAFIGFLLYKDKQYLSGVFVTGLVLVGSYQNRWVPFTVLVGIFFIAPYLEKLKPVKVLNFVVMMFLIPLIMIAPLEALSPDKTFNPTIGGKISLSLPENCKLLNSSALGGTVIFHRPDVKVSSDGRNDFYNSIEDMGQYEVLHSDDEQWVDQWLDDNEVTCILSDETRNIHNVLNMDKWELLDSQDQDMLFARK